MSDMIFVEVSIKRIGTANWRKEFIRINEHTINEVHLKMSKDRPYCFINFNWNKGESFILGAPHQMLVDQDRMTIQEYMEKWYLV